MALSLGTISTAANRMARRLAWFVTNEASDLGAPATGDALLVYDASDNYEPKYSTLAQTLGGATATQIFTQGTPAAVNATATITAAELLTGIITSTTGAAVAGTLPLASDLETALLAAYPALAVNSSFDFSVVNTGGSNTFTVTTNTGWTLVGGMAVSANSTLAFRARRTAASTYTLYRIS